MTERSVNENLIKVLRQQLPTCEIIKHADRFTAGVPDMSVSWGGATTWLELKLLRRKYETVHNHLDQAQLVMCSRLEKQTGRCWIVAYQVQPYQTLIYRPTQLLANSLPEGYLETRKWELCGTLWRQGVVQFNQFAHYRVGELIRQTHAR